MKGDVRVAQPKQPVITDVSKQADQKELKTMSLHVNSPCICMEITDL